MRGCVPLPLSALPVWKEPPEAAAALCREALDGFSEKVIVLDDDPTGTQTVHGVKVYTDWSRESLLDCFQDENSVNFILTNSRSFPAARTGGVHREIAENIRWASARTGRDFVLVSRGDSTMRGHWPLETRVLAETLAGDGGKRFDGEILLPFFLEGGRFTFGNVHYVRDGETLVPMGKSEFARDASFGYAASDLTEWCQEKTGGACRAEDCICIPLEDLRGLRVERIAARLMEAEGFARIIVNAVCYADLQVFCAAYLRALRRGKRFLFRTAASWVRVLGGISPRPPLTRGELVTDAVHGGIILVGSHVGKTTRQLENLKASGLAIHFEEFNAALAMEKNGLKREIRRVISEVEKRIVRGTSVCVYTTRKRVDTDDLSGEERLRISVEISDAVTSVIGGLSVRPAFIAAKGGITSSDVGVKALGVKRVEVMGQIIPGVPVWMTGEESKFPHMPYVIFPGNVGDDAALTTVAGILMDRREEP